MRELDDQIKALEQGFSWEAQARYEGRVLAEEEAIHDWVDVGAPSPLEVWLERKGLPSALPEPDQPPDVSRRGLLTVDETCSYLGGISRDSFDRHVRRKVSIRNIGDRPFVEVESLRAFARSGTKSLR